MPLRLAASTQQHERDVRDAFKAVFFSLSHSTILFFVRATELS